MWRCAWGSSAIQARPPAESDTVDAVWSVPPPISQRTADRRPPATSSSIKLSSTNSVPAVRPGPFARGRQKRTVTLRGRLRVSAAEGIREGVLADLGLSIGGSEWLFSPELKSGAVIAVLQDWSLPAMDLWALFPAGRQASVKARAFTSFIERHLAGREVV